MKDGYEEPASFPITIDLPESTLRGFRQACNAVKQEYEASAKTLKLKILEVLPISDDTSGRVYALLVGTALDFDWTFEGAIAYRSNRILEIEAESNVVNDMDSDRSKYEWYGEVLWVDEEHGVLYVSVDNPEQSPVAGECFVRPFNFLTALYNLYVEEDNEYLNFLLASRLDATEGGIHPNIRKRQNGGTVLPQLWQKSWSLLWGPPGTGKTYTAGNLLAEAIQNGEDRILLVSTTNKATDEVALSLGHAAKKLQLTELNEAALLRIGKGAAYSRFEKSNLLEMLKSTEAEYLRQIEELGQELDRCGNASGKALIRHKIQEMRKEMRDRANAVFLAKESRVICCTAFKAASMLACKEIRELLYSGSAPFTTVVIDEAGLISRAATACLSLLASDRVMLVGDPRQLAPISKISRILPHDEMKWLAKSGLSHLSTTEDGDGYTVIREQRRMHQEICEVVSSYQYDNQLTTHLSVLEKKPELPDTLKNQPRAIWYVLDEDGQSLANIRAERGPGGKSWVRNATIEVLNRLFQDPSFASAKGLFISPFRAQARRISQFFAERNLKSWQASTVHSQQGAEANVVIYDTVNASCHTWPLEEWKRLTNVALSRSKQAVIVLASRSEMQEIYLAPLATKLSPRIAKKQRSTVVWQDVPQVIRNEQYNSGIDDKDDSIGNQLASRKKLAAVLSSEQQRLCGLTLDGKPRLVRGVAGSGKTTVMANWITQTLTRNQSTNDLRIVVVFANIALRSVIVEQIKSAWEAEHCDLPFPTDKLEIIYIADLLNSLGQTVRDFDYDSAASAVIKYRSISPVYDALFVDEAQDMGPNTLKLLTRLVKIKDTADSNSRSVNIFFDNAQNIYGREKPKWGEMGLNMQGRSTVMKESFRSTKPINELAFNLLYRLVPDFHDPDHKELIEHELIEHLESADCSWWRIRFNQVYGPLPTFAVFDDPDEEYRAIARDIKTLITKDKVQPNDITILYNGDSVKDRLVYILQRELSQHGWEFSVQKRQSYERMRNTVVITTPYSFKGHESEIVYLASVQSFAISSENILAKALYVGMTRARSLLKLYGHHTHKPRQLFLLQTLRECLEELQRQCSQASLTSRLDLANGVRQVLGPKHSDWFESLLKQHDVCFDPIHLDEETLLAEPLFWYVTGDEAFAFFGEGQVGDGLSKSLQEHGYQLLRLPE